jgi:hypothetical protein
MYCGGTRQTYELAFASGSDVLQGSDWPILAAVAALMKTDGALKIDVIGHTDYWRCQSEAGAQPAASGRGETGAGNEVRRRRRQDHLERIRR